VAFAKRQDVIVFQRHAFWISKEVSLVRQPEDPSSGRVATRAAVRLEPRRRGGRSVAAQSLFLHPRRRARFRFCPATRLAMVSFDGDLPMAITSDPGAGCPQQAWATLHGLLAADWPLEPETCLWVAC
jgi:hypothetical protein